MEYNLKNLVLAALEVRFDQPIEITDNEWEIAKREAFNDIYANLFCFSKDASYIMFVKLMVNLLVIVKSCD